MQKIDVPHDHEIIKALDNWRESIDLELALVNSDSTRHDYDSTLNKEEIMKELSEDYLIETIIPNENKHDFGKTNLVDLNITSDSHKNVSDVFETHMQFDNMKFDRVSGAFWYPPNGYMGWHSNADHDAYRLYATWSEKGLNSFFRYRDPVTGEVVTSWDKKGWTFRMFNCTAEQKVWHCVYSGGSRISLGFWYDRIPTSV